MNALDRQVEIQVQQELARLIENPHFVIQAYQKALVEAEDKIEKLQPKADFYDIVAQSDTLFEMTSIAKLVNFKSMGRNKLFSYLRRKEILRYNNEPYQRYVDAGYFKVIEKNAFRFNKIVIDKKTMTTQKGLQYVIKKLKEDGYESNA